MKFIINTASWNCDNSAPCEKAYLEDGEWHVDIDTLDELMKLIDEVNSSIIVDSYENKHYIVIYDAYIE